jgi:hypothetical protein
VAEIEIGYLFLQQKLTGENPFFKFRIAPFHPEAIGRVLAKP